MWDDFEARLSWALATFEVEMTLVVELASDDNLWLRAYPNHARDLLVCQAQGNLWSEVNGEPPVLTAEQCASLEAVGWLPDPGDLVYDQTLPLPARIKDLERLARAWVVALQTYGARTPDDLRYACWVEAPFEEGPRGEAVLSRAGEDRHELDLGSAMATTWRDESRPCGPGPLEPRTRRQRTFAWLGRRASRHGGTA